MLGGLTRKVAKKLGISWATGKVRQAAQGDLGLGWKSAYWNLAGRKTWTGLVLGAVAAGAAALGYPDVGAWVGGAAALLVQWGLLDKAWRGQLPDGLKQNGVYRFLTAHSADVTVLFGLAAAAVNECASGGSEPCAWGVKAMIVLAAVAAQLGIIDAAWKTPGPIPADPIDPHPRPTAWD